jgi:hypothetical protein
MKLIYLDETFSNEFKRILSYQKGAFTPALSPVAVVPAPP